MTFVTLVRHGQANSAARDETGYDRLSELGWQQARWLGDYFDRSGERFARVVSGTLRRHVETAEGIAHVPPEEVERDPRLNEMAYFTMATAMEAQHGIAVPESREGFIEHLPLLLEHWRQGRLEGIPESFATFETRVGEALQEISAGRGPALVVTSGGLIGMAMRIVMGLDTAAMAHLCLAIENTSLHRVQPLPTGLAMTQFNAIPHMDSPERRHARSHL